MTESPDGTLPRESTPEVSATGRPLSPSAQRRALLICNGRVDSLKLYLPGVAKDAENLTKLLGDEGRGGFKVTGLLDEGLWAVRKAIAEACAVSGADDTLLIYYSGNSLCDERGELMMPVADSDAAYFFATCIEAEFVLAQMRRSRCQRFVLIIDGCHSGAFFRNNRGIPDGMIALTSCRADEVAMDTPEGGAFTQSLVRALLSHQTDADHDGAITVDDVYEFVRKDPVLAREPVTHPQKWVWNLQEPIVLMRTTTLVFLSYSRSDSTRAEIVTKALENHGIAVWRDITGIAGGAEWRDSLVAAFGKSQALIFLMSDEALQSKWVRRELQYADSKGLPIIPLSFDDIQTPDWFQLQFGGIQRERVDSGDVESVAARLAAIIRGAVSRPGDANTPGAPVPEG